MGKSSLTRIKLKVPPETPVARNPIIHYILFLLFLLCIIVQNSSIFDTSKDDITENKPIEIDYKGLECAYKVEIQKPIRAWNKTIIYIKYNKNNRCKQDLKERLIQNGGSVFRIHAYSVYEMVTTTSTHKENEIYVAELMLTFPTKYVVMVMLTYVNSLALDEKEHVAPILKQLPHSPFTINVVRSAVPNNLARYCTPQEIGGLSQINNPVSTRRRFNVNSTSVDVETTLKQRHVLTGKSTSVDIQNWKEERMFTNNNFLSKRSAGRWVKCGGAIQGLERCGPWQSPDFDFDHIHGFRWVPYSCQYHQYTNDQVKKCFAKKQINSIVFAGDSHMRYRAYHWVTRLYGSCHACVKTHIKMVFNKVPRIEWIFDARGTRLPLTFPNITLPYEKYVHPKVRRSKFSYPFPDDAMQSKLFLLNFGHWILREINDLNFIRKKLIAYAEAAKLLQNQGKIVIWISTVSLPWRTDKSVIDWRENTSPYRVRQLNKIADVIMTKYGIPVVDAFLISDGRIAATHDQTHYTKKLIGNDYGGVVENAISNVVFNLLCNK